MALTGSRRTDQEVPILLKKSLRLLGMEDRGLVNGDSSRSPKKSHARDHGILHQIISSFLMGTPLDSISQALLQLEPSCDKIWPMG